MCFYFLDMHKKVKFLGQSLFCLNLQLSIHLLGRPTVILYFCQYIIKCHHCLIFPGILRSMDNHDTIRGLGHTGVTHGE